MKTIETTGIVSDDGKLTVDVPNDVRPGAHRVVLLIDEAMDAPYKHPGHGDDLTVQARDSTDPDSLTAEEGIALAESLGFRVMRWEGWPPYATFRREDLYDDDGR